MQSSFDMTHRSLSRRCCLCSPSVRCTPCWVRCTGPNCTCTAAARMWAAGWRTSCPPRRSRPSSRSPRRTCCTWVCRRHFCRWIRRCCRCRRCSPPRRCRLRSRCNGRSLGGGFIYQSLISTCWQNCSVFVYLKTTFLLTGMECGCKDRWRRQTRPYDRCGWGSSGARLLRWRSLFPHHTQSLKAHSAGDQGTRLGR